MVLSWTSQGRASEAKGGTLQEKSDSEINCSLFIQLGSSWAPIVEIELGSVHVFYSTCIKGGFHLLEQIINTFHQRCGGGGLTRRKK